MPEFNVHGTPEAVAALFAALDIARSQAVVVFKDSRSNLGAYASSESVMVAARLALREVGLSVSPADSELIELPGTTIDAVAVDEGGRVVQGPDGAFIVGQVVGGGLVLQRGYVVGHALGAWFRASMSWPVLARPDPAKGTGSSETMAFSYFLRTLLMMPRMKKDDMDARVGAAMRGSARVGGWRSTVPMTPLGEGAGEDAHEGDPPSNAPQDREDAPPEPPPFDAEQSRQMDLLDGGA